jgi:probable phosphoglycerate mutase
MYVGICKGYANEAAGSFFINPDQHGLQPFVPPPHRPGTKLLLRALRGHVPFHCRFNRAMTATVLLVRHAAHVELGRLLSGRRRDIALSAQGLEQAAILGDLLGTQELAAVYSSPRERAWYTAREVAEPHGIKVTAEERLDEIDFGDWTGRSYAELGGEPAWTEWNEQRGSARVPGGETMGEATDRAFGFLEEAARENADRTIVAVSHCDVIRGVVARCMGLALDNVLRFDVDPASVSRVAIGSWGSRVLSVNERLYQ